MSDKWKFAGTTIFRWMFSFWTIILMLYYFIIFHSVDLLSRAFIFFAGLASNGVSELTSIVAVSIPIAIGVRSLHSKSLSELKIVRTRKDMVVVIALWGLLLLLTLFSYRFDGNTYEGVMMVRNFSVAILIDLFIRFLEIIERWANYSSRL